MFNFFIYCNLKYFFFFLLYVVPLVKSLQPYNSFFLEDFEKFVVIYDNQISFYNSSQKLKELYDYEFKTNDQKINSYNESEMISIGIFNEINCKEIYIIVKDYLYNYLYNGQLITNKTFNFLKYRNSDFIPYNIITEDYTYSIIFFILFDLQKNLNIYKYKHKLRTDEFIQLKSNNINLMQKSKKDSISCQKMINENNTDVLTCFYENEISQISAMTIDVDSLRQYNGVQIAVKENKGGTNIKSIVFNSYRKAFVCYVDQDNDIACIIFDIINNKWEEEYKYITNIRINPPIYYLDYFSRTDEYMLSSYSSETNFQFILLDSDMYIIGSDYNSPFCLTNWTIDKTCKNDGLPTIIRYYDLNEYKLYIVCQYLESKITTVSNKCKKEDESSFIIKKNINKTLEETVNELNDLIKTVDETKVYELISDDYLVKISPINFTNFEISSTYINFEKCENTLRLKNNLSPEDILTVVMIEIDKKDHKSLINQVEYAVYNNKKKLDLSVCENDEIEINYAITNESLLNLQLISKFSDIGVDIFDSKNEFFNDICYPYSENNSDMILKDRISYIYQNYSICDNNCDYEKMNINLSTITCKCSINKVIKYEIPPLRFDSIILDLLTNSSFGVVKCYNLVFNFKIKFNNIGFWIFSIIILLHIPFIILYFKDGINPINKYIINEMKKYNYYTNIYNPIKKKKKQKKQKNINNNLYQINFINFGEPKIQDKSINNNNTNENNNNSLYENKTIINDTPIIKKKIKFKKKSCKNLSLSHKKILNMDDSNKIIENKYLKKSINSDKRNLNNFIKDKKEKIIDEKIIKDKILKNEYILIQINADNSLDNKPPESNTFLDNYDYENAIKYENRSFSKIYYICLLSKENFLNIVKIRSPLELNPIRLIVLIFTYSCDFALNTVFYFNDNISDKYNYQGKNLYLFTTFNNLFISLLSNIICFSLVNALEFLTNSKDNVERLFRDEEKKMRDNNTYTVSKKTKVEILIKIYHINKNLKVKIICFLIIEFLIMLFFYYFVTAFCEVYNDTQISWLLDCFVSFILSFPIEFLNTLLISLLYIISVKMKIKWIYQIAMLFYSLG